VKVFDLAQIKKHDETTNDSASGLLKKFIYFVVEMRREKRAFAVYTRRIEATK
jgi:hypothetical protein